MEALVDSMPFPKNPKKPVNSSLKLVVKPAGKTVEVETGLEDEYKDSPDESGKFSFNLPRGFVIDEDLSSVHLRQASEAFKRLQEIKEKTNKCKGCRSKTSLKSVSEAYSAVMKFEDIVAFDAEERASFIAGQEPNGAITLECRYKEKAIILYFHRKGNSIGAFLGPHSNYCLVDKDFKEPEQAFRWLVGVEDEE